MSLKTSVDCYKVSCVNLFLLINKNMSYVSDDKPVMNFEIF
jgi:hypothetical protein